MTSRVTLTCIFLAVGISGAIGAEQIARDALMEKTRHWKEPKVAIWYYVGSQSGRDFFQHYDLGVSEVYSVATGEIPLPNIFPRTKKQKDWVVMKWGPAALPHSTSNKPLEPTAGRRIASLFITKTRLLQARLALASGGSAPSR
jgi:hypothetical protein